MTAAAGAPPPADHLAAYWDAVLADDVEAALAVVDRAAGDRSRAEVLELLVGTSQTRVGQLWQDGDWSVAREHAATAVSEKVVRDHLDRALAARPAGPGASPVVVTCAEREWHALPSLLLAATLAERGFPVVHLGADVSAQRLHGALLDAPAAAVLVSASLVSSLPRVRAQVETARLVGVPVVVGGHAFDLEGRRAAAIGATAHASDALTTADLLPTLPRHVPPAPALHHDDVGEAVLLDVDTPRVVDTVRDRVLAAGARDAATPTGDDWVEVLGDQLPYVVGSLAAALLVQDPAVMAETRGWLRSVLARRSAPESTLDDVWRALHETLHDFPAACRALDHAAR